MIFKLISFLVFSSLAAGFSVSEYVARNDSPILHDARTEPNNFLLVNPNQVRRLERTIRNIFSKMAEPTDKPIALKSSNSHNLLSTIREICKCIRERLAQLAHDVGLIDTVRRYEKSSNETSLSDDWYSELLLQSVYVIRDLGNMINEISSSTGFYPGGEKNATFRERSKQLSRQANGFKFLGVVHDIADYSDRLFQCLLEMMDARKHGSSVGLNRAIFGLMEHSPKAGLETLKFTARNTSRTKYFLKSHPRGQKSWHVFLCLSMLNEGVDYNDCVRELQRFDECMNSSRQPSSAGARNTDVKSWTRAIRRLSDCKILVDRYGETKISCQTDRRAPMKIERKARYVFEGMLGKKISKGSSFYRAAGELGETLSKSEFGQRFVDELCQYVGIYDDGQRKLKRLSKSVHRDKKAMVRHREISKALQLYKKGTLARTFRAINKMHHSAIDFEKFFAEGMKDTLKEAWQSHVRILSSLMDWMTKLLELHNGGSFSEKEPSSSDTSTSQVDWNSDENSNSENMQEIVATRTRSEMIKDVDSSMNSLIESMNHLTRHGNASNKNTLTCIANNLLLVMIFMETIGFVSSLYCLGHSTNDQTSSELDNEWNRERRSLVSAEYDEIVDFISRDYLRLDKKRKRQKNSE